MRSASLADAPLLRTNCPDKKSAEVWRLFSLRASALCVLCSLCVLDAIQLEADLTAELDDSGVQNLNRVEERCLAIHEVVGTDRARVQRVVRIHVHLDPGLVDPECFAQPEVEPRDAVTELRARFDERDVRNRRGCTGQRTIRSHPVDLIRSSSVARGELRTRQVLI